MVSAAHRMRELDPPARASPPLWPSLRPRLQSGLQSPCIQQSRSRPQPSRLTTKSAVAAPPAPGRTFDPGYDFDDADAEHVSAQNAPASIVNRTANGAQFQPHTVPVLAPPSEAEVALKEELGDCEDWMDVLQVVQEEADVLTPICAAEALARVAQLAKAAKELSKPAGSPEFQSLLQMIDENVAKLSHKEVARSLWALGTLKHKPLKFMRTLCAQAQAILPSFNTQDLATTMWAFGSLRYNPGTLLQDMTAQAASVIFRFEPKGLSMLLWGLSQNATVPEGPLLKLAADHIRSHLPEFGAQALANAMQALSKLDYYSAPLCSAVEQTVAANMSAFPPREFSSLLWVFVNFRHAPSANFWEILTAHLVSTKGSGTVSTPNPSEGTADPTTIQKPKKWEVWNATHWATLIWTAGKMYWKPPAELWGVLDEAVEKHMADFKPQELTNMLWGMAILGECHRPLFRHVFDAIVSAHDKRPMEPRLMRQICQGIVLASASDTPLDVSPGLELTARKWWRSAVHGAPVSLSHARVAARLRSLGLNLEVQVALGDGLPIIDVVIEHTDGVKYALQVVGPHDCMRNTAGFVGRAVSDSVHLQRLGYVPIMLRIDSLPSGFQSQLAQLQFLSTLMSSHGLKPPKSAREAQASTPDEFAPTRRQGPTAPTSLSDAPPTQQQQQAFSNGYSAPDDGAASIAGQERAYNGVTYSNGAFRQADASSTSSDTSSRNAYERARSAAVDHDSADSPDASTSRQGQPGYSFNSTRPSPRRSTRRDSTTSPGVLQTGSQHSDRDSLDRGGAPTSPRRDNGHHANGGRSYQPDSSPWHQQQSQTADEPLTQGDSKSAWGRVDASAADSSLATADGSWGRWDVAPHSPSTPPSPQQNGRKGGQSSSARPSQHAAAQASPRTGRGVLSGKGPGLRRTRNSLDLKSMDRLPEEKKDVGPDDAGFWNEW